MGLIAAIVIALLVFGCIGWASTAAIEREDRKRWDRLEEQARAEGWGDGSGFMATRDYGDGR